MRSRTVRSFRTRLASLPPDVRRQAEAAHALFEADPFHQSLQFKQLRGLDLWSVRIGASHRALAIRADDVVTWYWIGTHAEYDQIVRRQR